MRKILLLAVLMPTCVFAKFVSYEAMYTLSGDLSGNIEKSQTVTETECDISSTMDAKKGFFGDTIEQSSKGVMQDGYCVPQTYSMSDKRKDKKTTVEVAQGQQNNLSYIETLSEDVADGHVPAEFTVVTEDGTQTFEVTDMGQETVTTKLGTFETEHVRVKGSKVQDDFWIAMDSKYGHVPVQFGVVGEHKFKAKLTKLEIKD